MCVCVCVCLDWLTGKIVLNLTDLSMLIMFLTHYVGLLFDWSREYVTVVVVVVAVAVVSRCGALRLLNTAGVMDV